MARALQNLAAQEVGTPAHGPLDEPGITFTSIGLVIEEWVSFEQWARYGRKLQLAEKGIQWALGDWVIHGETHFKERAAQAVEFTGLKIKTLQNYATVAQSVDQSRRRDSDVVDYSTHVEVASLPADEQEQILAEAERDPGYTVKQARRAVHKAKRRLGKQKSELELLHTPEVKEYLDRYLAALKELEESVPLTARFLRLMAQSHQAQVHWQMNRSIDADCEAIMLPVKKYGAVAEDDLYTWLIEHGYFMSDPELDERLDYMQRDDVRMLRITDAGKAGKQEERRGKLPQIYVKWFKDWGEHYKQHRPEEDDEE
jgi:hypothetical protein